MRKMNEIGCGIGYCSRLKSKILLETKLDTDGGLGSTGPGRAHFSHFPDAKQKEMVAVVCCRLLDVHNT